MADADIGRLIAIIEREAPIHKQLLEAMIARYKKEDRTPSANEAQVEAAKAAAIVAFNAVKADPSDENKTALQNSEAVYYLAISNLVDDAPESEKEFQHYMLGKLKGSAIDVAEQVAAGSNMPDLERVNNANTVTVTSTDELGNSGASAPANVTNNNMSSNPAFSQFAANSFDNQAVTPAAEEPVAEPNGNNMRKMFGNDSNAFAAETPAPVTPSAEPVSEPNGNNMRKMFGNDSNSFAAETPAAAEPVSEPNGNNMRKMFGNDSNAFVSETPAPETPEPVTAPAPAAALVPEGWEKEEVEEYEKLSEAQKKTYDEIRPTIGLNNSVKNWKNVMDVAKGVEKKKTKGKKQKGGAKAKHRSVTPIGNKLDISLKKSKKSKTAKKSKSSKKSRKSKA